MVAHARSGRDGTGAGAGRDHPVEAAEDWRGRVAQPAPHPTAVEQPPSLSAALRPGGPGVGQRLQRGEDCPGTLKNNGGWGHSVHAWKKPSFRSLNRSKPQHTPPKTPPAHQYEKIGRSEERRVGKEC